MVKRRIKGKERRGRVVGLYILARRGGEGGGGGEHKASSWNFLQIGV